MDKTKAVLAAMLKENTGTHFLDSGGAYGRSWQRNQAVEDFDKRPDTAFEARVYKHGDRPELETNITLDLFHWLSERLSYEPQLDRIFEKLAARPSNEKEYWLSLAEAFPEWICKRLNAIDGGDREPHGIYGEGEPMCVNTYNGEDCLSQTIQYVYFTVDSHAEAYVLLQIHGGADVRGGYTRPRVFSLGSYDETAIFDNAKCSIGCTGKKLIYKCSCGERFERPWSDTVTQVELCPKCMQPIQGKADSGHCEESWYSDDGGYHWYSNNSSKDLKEYPVAEVPDEAEEDVTASKYFERGTVLVDPRDHSCYCPECGGKLAAGAY